MTRRAQDSTKALDAFLAAKFEIDAMLERLTALSDDHFEIHPDEIDWGDVGTLQHYRAKLKAKGHSASPRTAIDLLSRIQKFTAHIGDKSFTGTTRSEPEQLDLFDAFSLSRPV